MLLKKQGSLLVGQGMLLKKQGSLLVGQGMLLKKQGSLLVEQGMLLKNQRRLQSELVMMLKNYRYLQSEIGMMLPSRMGVAIPSCLKDPFQKIQQDIIYRVGDYRLFCQIKDGELIVLVIEIGHRKEIYR